MMALECFVMIVLYIIKKMQQQQKYQKNIEEGIAKGIINQYSLN